MITGNGQALWVEGDRGSECAVLCWSFALERYIQLCGIYTKDEVPRQRDYSLTEDYPKCAVRSQCAVPRPSDLQPTGGIHKRVDGARKA